VGFRTPHRVQKQKTMKKSLEQQLGYYVGDYIVMRHLPTLSTDLLQTRYVIKVSEEESKTHELLNNDWLIDSENKNKWNALRRYSNILGYKYYPNPLICYVPKIEVENIEEFKTGLIDCFWNCDRCSYSLKSEEIKIYNDEYSTIIELKLDLSE